VLRNIYIDFTFLSPKLNSILKSAGYNVIRNKKRKDNKMETTIYLVRHAQTDSNATGRFQGWTDVELNEYGLSQARLVAECLSDEAIDVIYTSPLKRTKTTAALIASRQNLTPLVLPDLAEINYGEWEGKSREEVKAKWPELLWKMRNDPTGAAVPGGESFADFYARSNDAFRQICSLQEGKKVIVVSHSGVIKAIVLNILGSNNAVWGKLDIDNTSISTVKLTGDIPHLTSLNNTSHLVKVGTIRRESRPAKLVTV